MSLQDTETVITFLGSALVCLGTLVSGVFYLGRCIQQGRDNNASLNQRMDKLETQIKSQPCMSHAERIAAIEGQLATQKEETKTPQPASNPA